MAGDEMGRRESLRQRLSLPQPERKDASMDLLNQILRNPVDPEYAEVANRPGPRRRNRPAILLAMVLMGALLTLSVVQNLQSAPVVAEERAQLVTQVEEANDRITAQRDTIAELQVSNDRRQTALLSGDAEATRLQNQIDHLAPLAGATPVTGPGLEIVVDDAPTTRDDQLNEVLDGDLQLMTNGLWRAGAEAIAINGHRITSVSAIRAAGDAITVNYRSLTRPYTITAIGDPATLPARFAESPEGRMWSGLRENYALRFEVQQRDVLELPADPSLNLRHARRL